MLDGRCTRCTEGKTSTGKTPRSSSPNDGRRCGLDGNIYHLTGELFRKLSSQEKAIKFTDRQCLGAQESA